MYKNTSNCDNKRKEKKTESKLQINYFNVQSYSKVLVCDVTGDF